MRRVQFGLVLPAGSPTADVNRALNLVAGHFDTAWMIDHLQDGASDMLESFTTISYLAALHPQLRFGQTVVCKHYQVQDACCEPRPDPIPPLIIKITPVDAAHNNVLKRY